MVDEKSTVDNSIEPDAVSAIPHFCPICGAIMTKQYVDGILCWVCPDPDCGFIDPV